jgi:hypothetical protein
MLFTLNFTIKLAKTPPHFGARRKLVATLRGPALDVLPCSRVHCAEKQSIFVIWNGNGRTDGSYEGARWSHVAYEVLRETSPVLRARGLVQNIAKYVTPAAVAGDSFHRACGIYAARLECDGLFSYRNLRIQWDSIGGSLSYGTGSPA